MNNAQKIILIPSEATDRFNSESEMNSSITNLDKEMNYIASLKDISDLEKWKKYREVLDRYLRYTQERREPIPLSVIDTSSSSPSFDSVRNDLFHVIPKTYTHKALALYDLLRNSNLISWDSKGVVTIDKEEFLNSNIIDLIGDTVRERKGRSPIGVVEFSNILKRLNIPTELIGNPQRRKRENIPIQSERTTLTKIARNWETLDF